MYDTSENFSYSDFVNCITELIEEINKLSKTQYKVTFPENTNSCPCIEEIAEDEKDLS